MRRHALDADRDRAGVEGLPDDFAKRAAVDRVGEVDLELLEVKELGAAKTDLFIGHEGDADVAVRTVFPRHDGEHRHHVRNGRLVVGTEHARAVRKDDVLTRICGKFRMLLETHPNVLLGIEENVPAFVVNHLRLHVGREAHGHRVEMRDPAHGGSALDVGGQKRRQDGVFVQFDLDEPERLEFLGKKFGEFALTFRARDAPSLGVAFGRNGDVAQEVVLQFGDVGKIAVGHGGVSLLLCKPSILTGESAKRRLAFPRKRKPLRQQGV